MMPPVSFDFETRSPVKLPKAGPRRYAEEAEVICMAYAAGDDEPSLWIPGDPFPAELAEATTLHAWNAGFERAIWEGTCTRLYGWPACPPPLAFVDTQARAALAGLPLALGMCAVALGLPSEYLKDARGKYLIQRLCAPGKDGRYNNDPDLLVEMYDYCVQDVVAERKIASALPPLPYREHRIWALTETINEQGVPIDRAAVGGAVTYADRAIEQINARVDKVTDGAVAAVSQVARLRGWLNSRGVEVDNLRAATIDALLAEPDAVADDVAEVLAARRAAGLASIKKFHAAAARVCTDGRVKDTLRYHGAGTGRWSSVGLQVQNIKRPSITPGDAARLLDQLAARHAMPGRSFVDGLAVLSDCVRGLIKAEPGHVLAASDYSQIELRVLLWLAQDDDNLDELRQGLDPYRTMAATIYTTEYDKVKTTERQVAKSAVLGCGYGLGPVTFGETYAKGMGIDLTPEESELIVGAYRTKYHGVVSFWYDLNDTVFKAIRFPGETFLCRRLPVRVYKNRRWLEILLPSGRPLRYFRPRIEPDVEKPWGRSDEIQFEGTDTYTRRWGVTSTYGGKLVENVTQGLARDIMAAGMLRAADAGLSPIMTVHDEVVCHPETGDPAAALAELNACLLKLPAWAAGLPLDVEGWTGQRYRK